MLKFSEVFDSVEGEGLHAGIPARFYRFVDCVLRCPFCDTKYSWNSEDSDILIDGYTTVIDSDWPDLIVFTGGEPLMHIHNEEFISFCNTLLSTGHHVAFETTGLEKLEDIKNSCLEVNLKEMHALLNYNDNVIFVVSPKLDALCYPKLSGDIKITIEDILIFYTLSSRCADDDTFENNVNFKLIYDDKYKEEIYKLIENISEISNIYNATMMPLTPIPFNREEYVSSCKRTVDFCIKNNLRYSPRLHVDIWGMERGK